MCHSPYEPVDTGALVMTDFSQMKPFPNQVRWSPFDLPTKAGVTFISGLTTLCGAGNAAVRNGIAIHIYSANTSMVDTAFYNADGDFLIGKGPLPTPYPVHLSKLYIFCYSPCGIVGRSQSPSRARLIFAPSSAAWRCRPTRSPSSSAASGFPSPSPTARRVATSSRSSTATLSCPTSARLVRASVRAVFHALRC